MALTLTRITGTVDLPNGETPDNGSVVFRLKNWDKDGLNVFVPGPVLAPIASDGSIDVMLQSTEATDAGFLYSVKVVYFSLIQFRIVEINLPDIAVPATGPVVLSDLLSIPAPAPTVPDALAQSLAVLAEVRAIANGIEDGASPNGSVTQVFTVPGDFPTVQDALNAARNIRVIEGSIIEIMIQSGFRPATGTAMGFGDMSHIRISSEDAEVVVADTFPNGVNGFTFTNCRTPIWNIVLDMNGRGRNGIWLEGAHMMVRAQKGVRRAGNTGAEPRGCGVFAWKGSNIHCEPVNVNGVLVGLIATDNAVRGVDITHNSQGSLVGGQFLRNGSANDLGTDGGHAHLFVSRSSAVQADNATFEGGVRAIRSARSMVSARAAVFRDVAGECVRLFEGGWVIVAAGEFRRCGAAGYPIFYVTGSSETRPQGGGYICAESGLILEPKGEVAVAVGGGALISLEDSIADDLVDRLARVTTGAKVVAARIAGYPASSAADEPTAHVSMLAGATVTEMVLASDASAFEALGGKLDANGLRNVVRLTNGATAHLRGASLMGSAQIPVRLDTVGCRAFLLGATLDGSWRLPSVFEIGITITPEHFGAVGDGVADDSAALATWAAAGGKQSLRLGAVYRLATRVEMIWPLNTDADLSAGIIRQEYIETSNNGFGQLYGRMKGLRWQFANDAWMERGLVLWPGASCTDFEVRADTDFPRNDDVRDGLFIVRGAGVTIKRGLFDGIYNPIQFYQEDNSTGTQIADIDFIRYGDGVSVRSNISANVILQNLRYHSINANSATDPGMNTITGGGPYMTASGIRHVTDQRGSGEHFLYSAVPDGTRGCDFSQVFSHSSGQCFMKFRGHADFRLSDCHGEGTSAENSIGTNEDGFRFENCRGLMASSLSIRRRVGAGPGGNDGLNLNNSWNMFFSSLVFEYQTRASIYLCTPPSTTYAQSPNQAVENININGMLCRVAEASKPLIMLGDDDGATTTTCKVGNITISGLDWDGNPANLVVVKSGITRQAVAGSAIRISGTIKGRPFSYVWAAADAAGTLTWLAA